MGGCSSLSQGPPLPSPPTKSTMSGPANVSSMEARVEFVPEVVGHTRRLTDEYDLGVQIGKGHYGFVFEAVQKSTGRRVAMKRIDKSLCSAFRIQEEIEILRRVGHHEGIVAMIDAFETPTHVEIVMELMEGGELYGRIATKGAYSEPVAALITRRLASAVRYLHRHGVVHRDLKPENLLLYSTTQDDIVKLADFGLAKHLVNQTHMTTVCGTWAYSAPEVRVFRQPYNYKVDIWSLGVIIFTMLGGYHPFDPYGTATEAELQDNMRELRFDFDDEVWEPISDEAKDLIVSMLRHNPKERPSAKRVLMHPWIQRFAPGDDYGSPTHSPTVAPSAVGFGQQAAQQRQMAQQDERSRMVPEHRSKSGSGGARSVDDTVFVDAVSRRPRDPNPSVKRATDRMDTASTMTSKGRRTLRPSRKPAETYEPVTLSPGHKVVSARDPVPTMPASSGIGRQAQWPELPQSQQATSLDRARAAISVLGTQNVSSMLAARAAAAQSQRPGYRSAANVNMDAGVMFGKGPHSSATPLVLAMHAPRQQQQQAATASHGRRAMDEAREFEGGDDGWEEYGDTGYRQARPAPTQSVRSDRHPELQQQGSWWRKGQTGSVTSASTPSFRLASGSPRSQRTQAGSRPPPQVRVPSGARRQIRV